MKTALIFLVAAILIFAGVYCYYLSNGGTPLEAIFNRAFGLQGEEEEGNGLPIVVNITPYVAITAILLGIGLFLHLGSKRRGKNLRRQNQG